ncbi:MAG TPA: hypothetical protein VFX02_01305 [Gammaproteobacteria bacterium]|nr:hypothetical protein [Gammaproteobacteria bacterium]
MNKNYYMIFAVTLAGLALPGSACALDLAVGAHGGTMGNGFEAALGLNSFVGLRAGVNSSDYEYDIDIEDEEGLEYQNPKFDFDNQYLMLDIFPLAGKFHLTAGYFKNNNSITTSGRVNNSEITIGGQHPAIDTEVTAMISFEDGGYAGFGFGSATDDGLINFALDIGVVMQGSPQVDIDVSDDSINEADINQEEAELEEENKDLEMWPLVNLSLSIHFF